MSDLERLRILNRLRPHATRPGAQQTSRAPRVTQRLEEMVQGHEVENEAGRCFVAEHALPLEHAHGPLAIGALLERRPEALAAYTPGAHMEGLQDFGQAVFLDTETTGLGPGASVYAFMVGVGSFEPRLTASNTVQVMYVVRQFFMRSPAEEPALLTALAHLLNSKNLIVTFNGRTFDLPLLRTRYQFNRRVLPSEVRQPLLLANGSPHLDLLHPARQLWKRRLQSCRLLNLEANILGVTRTEADVPGSLIPQMYVEYVRTGAAEQMQRVFYHNREDIVSTQALTTHVYRLLEAELQTGAAVHEGDWLAVGAAHERAGRLQLAEEAYARATGEGSSTAATADAFARLARVRKKRGAWREAIAAWELWVTTIRSADATPYIELAKCYEWEVRDLEQAEMWAAWGLHTLQNAEPWQRLPGQLADLERRPQRIRDKRARRA